MFKAATIIPIDSIQISFPRNIYKLSLQSFFRSPCFVKQIAEHESYHILLSSNYQIAFMQSTVSTKYFVSMNCNETVLKVFVIEILH